jgi:hypothetical protein
MLKWEIGEIRGYSPYSSWINEEKLHQPPFYPSICLFIFNGYGFRRTQRFTGMAAMAFVNVDR